MSAQRLQDDLRAPRHTCFRVRGLLSYVGGEVPSTARAKVMLTPHRLYQLRPRRARDRDHRRHRPERPAGLVATPTKAQLLLRSMLAYAGKYTIDTDAKTVTHQIDVSRDESRTGGSFVRNYGLGGDRLTPATPASTDPASARTAVRTLTWEKIEDPRLNKRLRREIRLRQRSVRSVMAAEACALNVGFGGTAR